MKPVERQVWDQITKTLWTWNRTNVGGRLRWMVWGRVDDQEETEEIIPHINYALEYGGLSPLDAAIAEE